MCNVNRVKVLMDFKDYNILKDYFKGKVDLEKDVILEGYFYNDYSVKIIICPSSFNHFAKVSIKLLDEKGLVVSVNEIIVNKISKIISLFSFNYNDMIYLINLDKNVDITKETALSRLNIVKWNSLNTNYVHNSVLFNSFSNNFELLETVFAVLYGAIDDIRENTCEDMLLLLKSKLEYYGFGEEDAVEIEDSKVIMDSNDFLLTLTGYLLYELYNPNEVKKFNKKEFQDFVYSQCIAYFDCLVEEKVLPKKVL